MDQQPGDRHERRGAEPPAPPAHRRLGLVAVVWIGGAAGTGARYLVTGAVPRLLGVPVGTIAINVAGAFALGVLLEALLRRGSDEGGRRVLRLLLGTGFLGGFTTYSALAVDTVTLLRDGATGLAVGYAGVTVVVGGFAALLGIALGARVRVAGAVAGGRSS